MFIGTPSALSLAMSHRVFPPSLRAAPIAARSEDRFERARGFTLLELLAVISIIAVLTAIVIGVGRHAAQASKIARAKAEMATLATSLEAYKSQYGDYPHVAFDTSLDSYTSSEFLYQSLSGWRGPLGQDLTTQQRILFESTRFTMADLKAPRTAKENHFIDPWGNPYRYAYKPTTAWTSSAYVLACAGPDETLTLLLPDTGILTPDYETAEANVDNIYANRN